jgi:DNA-binding LacI/PurR family transcriptional regulator
MIKGKFFLKSAAVGGLFMLLVMPVRAQRTALSFSESELHSPWVDSVYRSLSKEQRIAQLMMVAAYSTGDKRREQQVAESVKRLRVGGLIFFQGGPMRQAALTNRYQAMAQTPLLIGMDA